MTVRARARARTIGSRCWPARRSIGDGTGPTPAIAGAARPGRVLVPGWNASACAAENGELVGDREQHPDVEGVEDPRRQRRRVEVVLGVGPGCRRVRRPGERAVALGAGEAGHHIRSRCADLVESDAGRAGGVDDEVAPAGGRAARQVGLAAGWSVSSARAYTGASEDWFAVNTRRSAITRAAIADASRRRGQEGPRITMAPAASAMAAVTTR